MGQAVSVPDVLEMLVGEILGCTWDFKNQLQPGDTLGSPTVTIVNLITNETVASAVTNSPFVLNGTIVNATISAVPLRPRTNYLCTVTGVVSSGGISALTTIIKVIF